MKMSGKMKINQKKLRRKTKWLEIRQFGKDEESETVNRRANKKETTQTFDIICKKQGI